MIRFVKKLATVAFLGLAIGAPAHAQFEWHPDKVLPPGLPNIPTPWDGRNHQPEASHFGDPVDTQVILVNPTPWHVLYWLNGEQKPQLQAGQSAKWFFHGNTENYPKMHITIDTGPGRPRAEYDLQDGHTYHFFLRNGGIDLGN